MTSSLKKTLLIAFGVLFVIVASVGIIYMVRKPATVATLPTPRPTVSPIASPVKAPVLVVDQVNACKKTFTVACASGSPSSSPSASPSPSSSPSKPPEASLDCVAKKLYVNDSRNRAGFYYMESEIQDANTVQNGQILVYNVIAKNNGGNSVPDTTITDTLSTSLTYLDGDSGCSYEASTRQVTCTIGTLAANSEAQRSFRATIAVTSTSSVSNTAEVSSTNGQRDSCSIKVDATGKVIVPPSSAPSSLPVAGVFEVTTGTVGIGLLLLILGGLGLLLI